MGLGNVGLGIGGDGGHRLSTVTTFGATETVEITAGGKKLYVEARSESIPRFRVDLTNLPINSSVYTARPDFTIGVVVRSGSLTSVNAINTSAQTGTIIANEATFTGTLHQAEGTYSITSSVSGFNSDVPPAAQTDAPSGSFTRFVPAYWVVGASPTALPAASEGTVFGGTTAIGNDGDGVYIVTPRDKDTFRFTVGPYEIEETFERAIDAVDVAGVSRSFNVWSMGKLDSTGRTTFVAG